jgi:hypothetical protein
MLKQIERVIRTAFLLMIFCWVHLQPAYAAMDVQGVIDTDSRWKIADSPIHITGDVRIVKNTTLTIDPGVEVIFQPSPNPRQGYSIRIDGALVARGKQRQPIRFTAKDPSQPWGTIMFLDTSRDWDPDTSAGSVMEYCIVEHGGNDGNSAAMVSIFNAMPLIAQNAIRFSLTAGVSAFVSEDPAGISSLSGDIQIISNRIYNNATGIRFMAEGGIIQDNYFLNNNRAIDLQVRSNDVRIINNTVYSSSTELFGAGVRLLFDEVSSGIKSYQWSQTAGTPVTLSNPQSATTAFIAPDLDDAVETLSFDLTVTNKDGDQSTKTIEISITGEYPPPVATAGADRNVQLPQEEGETVSVTLSGAGSSDPYLGIAAYAWEQTDGKTVKLVGAKTIRPTFDVPDSVSAGDRMTFKLTVTNLGGLTSDDSMDIVYYDDNIFPVADAGADQTVLQGTTVVLNGTGSTDPDGGISAFKWEQTDGPPVNLLNANTAMPYFKAPAGNTAPETLTFGLEVTDNGGLQSSDEVSITVNGTLIAEITAGSGSAASGDMVVLDGSASIDQNAAADIVIQHNTLAADSAGAGLIALTAAENTSFILNLTGNNFSAAENDAYIIYAYDWFHEAPPTIDMPDNWWGTVDTAIIDSLIYDKENNYNLPAVEYNPFEGREIADAGSSLPYPPLADAGADLVSVADNLVTLDGSGSYDPDGIAVYRWEQIAGPAVDLKTADQAVASFIAPAGGDEGISLEFRLTVSTDDSFSHSDTVNVAVTPDGALPKVDVGGCFIESARLTPVNDSLFGKILSLFFLFSISAVSVAGVFYRLRKSVPAVFIVPAVLLLISVPSHAGYFSVGGGAGGDADEVNMTLEIGAKDIDLNNFDMLFGIGMLFVPHSDNEIPDGTISLPCPNDDCTRLGNFRKGTGVGFFGKLGTEIGSSDFYVSAIGGFNAYTESRLSRSPATGRVYEDSSDSKVEALYGGGISYFFDYKWNIVIQLDYDNIRGGTGTIGWHW